MIHIRGEMPADRDAVRAVVVAAFGAAVEADLVDDLRAQGAASVSLVAVEVERIVGHVLFSPAVAAQSPDLCAFGLAPLAVVPERQRQGIGQALVREGLDCCRALGADLVVVLGHPDYYPRFGFVRARDLGLDCDWDAPDAFQALRLTARAASVRGLVRYHEAFSRFE